MNKRGNLLIVIIIILALIILAFILIEVGMRECNSNRDCPRNAYCNSQHECREYPANVAISGDSNFGSALTLGIFLVIAAFILKTGRPPFWKSIKKIHRKVPVVTEDGETEI